MAAFAKASAYARGYGATRRRDTFARRAKLEARGVEPLLPFSAVTSSWSTASNTLKNVLYIGECCHYRCHRYGFSSSQTDIEILVGVL